MRKYITLNDQKHNQKHNRVFFKALTPFIAVLLSVMAISLASCSKEDAKITPEKEDIIEVAKGKVWGVNAKAIKGEEDSNTKSLNVTSSNNSSLGVEDGWDGEETKLLYTTGFDANLHFEWEDNQEIEVYNGDTKVGTLRVNSGGSKNAILKGSLTGTFNVGDELTLYTISKERNYNNQKGNLDDLGKNFDYAVATTKITQIDDVNDLLYLDVARFESQQSVNKFLIPTGYGTSITISKLTISGSGLVGESVTVVPENIHTTSGGTIELFVALSNPKDKKITYNFTMELSNGKVLTTYKRANLKNGKYYKATISGSAFYETIKEPLTIEALQDGGTITIQNPHNKKIFYAVNSLTPNDFGNISVVTTDANPITISVNEGDRVQLYGNSFSRGYGDHDYSRNSTVIKCNIPHYVYGNTNSLRYSQGWWTDENSQEVSDYMYTFLFAYDTELLSHPSKKIILPAKKVGLHSYRGMFVECSKMTIPPDLPATTLAEGCYDSMFGGCGALTYAPELPATTLAEYCYRQMFYMCTSLESSPILPAKTLVDKCYFKMFFNCRNLRQITCYAQDISAQNCLDFWTENVSPTGIFIKDESTSWPSGDNGIPTGWTNDEPFTIEAIADGDIVITNPQGLSIKYGKTISLNNAVSENSTTITIPVVAGDKVRFWGNNSAYGNGQELYLCTNIKGTAEHYAYGDLRSLLSDSNYPNVTTLEDGAFCRLFCLNDQLKSHPTLELRFEVNSVGEYACSQMFFGCEKLQRAPKLPATIVAPNCYEAMFSQCYQLTEAPTTLPATTLREGCYAAMFQGCISLVNAPTLPATTLAGSCYSNMFDFCPSLQTAPELPAATLVNFCYAYMFRDCEKLNDITCLATNLSATGATECWVENVATSGKFTKKGTTPWPSGINGIPTGWSVGKWGE